MDLVGRDGQDGKRWIGQEDMDRMGRDGQDRKKQIWQEDIDMDIGWEEIEEEMDIIGWEETDLLIGEGQVKRKDGWKGKDWMDCSDDKTLNNGCKQERGEI